MEKKNEGGMEAVLNAVFGFLELISSTQDVSEQMERKWKNWVRNESCGRLQK